MKKLKTALLLVLVVAVLTGCTTFNNFKEAFFSDGGNNSDTIKIGVLEPQTGNDSQKGEMEIRGIQLANELVPEVLGKKIELVYADTQSSIYVAESAVSDLIDKAPAVVLGSYGDAVTLAASKPLWKRRRYRRLPLPRQIL
ncbi:MAG: ABC transporter substrate-binding protein [Anaerovoracaceae bacterium]